MKGLLCSLLIGRRIIGRWVIGWWILGWWILGWSLCHRSPGRQSIRIARLNALTQGSCSVLNDRQTDSRRAILLNNGGTRFQSVEPSDRPLG